VLVTAGEVNGLGVIMASRNTGLRMLSNPHFARELTQVLTGWRLYVVSIYLGQVCDTLTGKLGF
jgi:hypothetical protein